MACALGMFFEPAVQHVGVHPVLPGQRCDGNTGLLARRHQLGLELWRVGPVCAMGRAYRRRRVFEHGVHDGLRAHDLARELAFAQDGFTGRLRLKHICNAFETVAEEPFFTLWMNLGRLIGYLESNDRYLVNYSRRHYKGLPISSSIAESAVNEVVSWRMAKKRQMR